MSGTYNEVQVKKLGRKKRANSQNPAQPKPGSNSLHATHGTHVEHAKNPGPGASENTQGASWPPSLQDFVNRSFEQSNALSAPQKAVFNEQIQTLIYAAARDKKIWTNDWIRQKLPVFDPAVPLALYQDVVGPGLGAHQTPAPPGYGEPHNQQKRQHPLPEKPTNFDSNERKRQRAARFQASASSPHPVQPSSAPAAGKSATIVGTSTALEKRYLRLTSDPDPALVRSKFMLGKCLSYVVDKYRSSGASYAYINDQIKAIRQDMTVQHITSGLAVRVYETHGRIAIENNDLGEFNQCQSQLKHLYAQRSHQNFYKNTYEFTCYRILYLLLTGNYADINIARLEIMDADSATVESELDPEFRIRRQCVYKALELADHVVMGNYHRFFALYKWFKGLGCMSGAFHLLDQFMANKQRVLSLNIMCKGFKKVPLALLESQLAIDSAPQFLAEFGLNAYVLDPDFDCSSARGTVQAIVDQGKFKKVDIKGQV